MHDTEAIQVFQSMKQLVGYFYDESFVRQRDRIQIFLVIFGNNQQPFWNFQQLKFWNSTECNEQ